MITATIARLSLSELRRSSLEVRQAELEGVVARLKWLSRRQPKGWSDAECMKYAESLFLIGHSCGTISLKLDKSFEGIFRKVCAKYHHRNSNGNGRHNGSAK